MQSTSGGFIANNVVGSQVSRGIMINTSHGVEIIDNLFENSSNHALWVVASDDVKVCGNRFLDNSIAFQCSDSSRLLFERNSIVGSRSAGITMVNSDGSLLSSAAMHNDGGGLFVDRGCEVTVESCTFAENRSGGGGELFVSDTSLVAVTNSIVWSRDAEAIFVESGGEATVVASCVSGGWPGESNIAAEPMLADPGAGDFHLTLGSPCVDRGVDTINLPAEDVDGQPRVIAGSRNGPSANDIGADELVPEIALRFGYVNQSAQRVLTLNGTSGDANRVVRVERNEPILLEMQTSHAGPSPAAFVVYVWLDAPDTSTFRKQPFSLGWTVFPTPLQREAVGQPIEIWNNLGRTSDLGEATRPSMPAPSVLAEVPRGFGVTATVTVQGLIQDNGSRAEGPVSVTNAIVVEAR